MSIDKPKISPRPGQVLIETGGDQSLVNGMIEVYQGVSPEQVLADKKKEAVPYLDYFVFSEPLSDPNNPQKSAVYVLVTEANDDRH